MVGRAEATIDRTNDVVGRAEATIDRTDGVVDGAEKTIDRTNEVVDRADEAMTRADLLVTAAAPLTERLRVLLDALEPSLTTLQPTLERLAESTSPAEVDALVKLVDQLPPLADSFQAEIIPILATLDNVSPDIHDMLDGVRELNQLLSQIPGLSRVKARIDRQQEEEGRG